MKDIEIKISKETREVYLKRCVIGNDAENLQGNLVFTFQDEFVKGQARLEYRTKENDAYLPLIQEEESYVMPIKSAITKQGQIFMQLVITEGIDEEEIPIFKSNVFFMTVNESINAELEDTNEYITLIDVINTKLNQIDNLDITVSKVDGVATITVTDKYGNQESVEIYDGDAGTGGGTTDYENLENKPSINDVELSGNKTLEELNIQPKGDYLTSQDISETDIENWNNKSDFSGSYNDLADKPTIPTKTSELTNDSGFLETVEEQGIFFFDISEMSVDYTSNKNVSSGTVYDKFNEKMPLIIDLIENKKIPVVLTVKPAGSESSIFVFEQKVPYSDSNIQYNFVGTRVIAGNGALSMTRIPTITLGYNGANLSFVSFKQGINLLRPNEGKGWTVSGNYNPTHKKYVDDSIASAISSAIGNVNSVLATLTTVEESE